MNQDTVTDLARGAIAGGAATWVMGQLTIYLYAREDPAARNRENAARGDLTAYEIAAEKGASLVGIPLSDDRRARAGNAIHWLTGAGAGALYAILRDRHGAWSSGWGLTYGAAFFLTVDEAANTLLGLTPGPRESPWQAHARGLAGHLAFGLAAELTLRTFDQLST